MSFIDLHSHCLVGLDDGVQSEEEALMMLHTAIQSDIKLLYVTPHREPNGRFDPDNDTVIKALKKLKQLAFDHNLTIDLRYGEEFRIKTDSIRLINADEVLCYSGTNYVLIEFTRTNVFSKLAQQAIEALKATNKKILIAHPERYFDDVNEGIKICKDWVNQGCFLQINRTSLLGVHGLYAEKIGHKLIKLGLAHCIASDAHEAKGLRVCRLDDIYFQIIKKYSQHQADMLLLVNPTHLTNNEPMEAVLKPKRRFVLIRKFKEKLRTPRKDRSLKHKAVDEANHDALAAASLKNTEENESTLAVKGE